MANGQHARLAPERIHRGTLPRAWPSGNSTLSGRQEATSRLACNRRSVRTERIAARSPKACSAASYIRELELEGDFATGRAARDAA
jgi:hypothetical protein